VVDGPAERHLAVCRRFGEAVAAAEGKWDRPSPCDEWDAKAILEHVRRLEAYRLMPMPMPRS
jgi:hypothetical protein